MNLFDENFPCSSKFTICIFIYSAFSAQRETESTYFTYLQSIQKKSEEINKGDPMIFEVFGRIIIKNRTQESYYLIEKMIERNLLDSKIAESINSIYFAHYHTIKESQQLIFDPFYEYFKANLERLSKNNWELHKKFVSKGVNPSKIAKVIRKDNIEKLQKIISSTPSFEFNQKIQPSLYERYSYISNRNISLVNYAAFFGSIKCFKYLLLNNAILENTSKYAVAGGNIEIVKICEQSHLSFEGSYEVAIKFHRNDIFHYIYENKLENINQEYKDKDVLSAHLLFSYGDIKRDIISFRVMCINFCNFEILKFLSGNKYGISDEELKYALISGNLFLVKCILENKIENESVIAYAADSGNIELVKYFIGKNEHIHNVNSADINSFCFQLL